jgi:hypothetical protein
VTDERPGIAAGLPGDAAPDAPAPVTAAPRPARRRRGTVVLSLLLVAALGLGGYLWYAADRWRADSDAWQSQAHAQAQRVRELEARLEASTQELTAARDQLATATARITTLANEKAQLGDANAASQQYLDYQKRVSEAAGVVAQALGRCTTGQSQLITYLRAPDQYDAADLERYAADVDTLCKQATAANDQLQQELQR